MTETSQKSRSYAFFHVLINPEITFLSRVPNFFTSHVKSVLSENNRIKELHHKRCLTFKPLQKITDKLFDPNVYEVEHNFYIFLPFCFTLSR
jgi:hypothetical protein